MKRIRKGKDITVRWPILTNGDPLSLDGRDLTLFVKSQYNVAKQVEFTTEDNIVNFVFYGTEQQMLGCYQLTLWENYGKQGQTAVDYCDAFELVSCTCKESGEDEGLKTETVDLEASTIEVGIGGGASAPIEIVQETGESTTSVMSQDAVTKAIQSESKRAEKAEQELAESIATESKRAETAEQSLSKTITAETSRATGEEAGIRQEFAAADAQEQAERKQKDAETLRLAKDYTDSARQDERTIREEAEQTILKSAQRYADVQLSAESDDREAADRDVLEQAKQHTETSIATERVVREAAERAIQKAVNMYTDQKVAELVNGSPEALDTLLEISEALGNNPNFASDILAQLGGKVDKVKGKGLSTEDYSTEEKSKLAGIASGATAVSVKRELGSGTKIATIAINGTTYDLYCQTNVDTTYSAGTGINLDGTKFSLSPSGVVEGTYGPATDVVGTDGQTITVPQITVDQYGRIISVTNRTLTNKNTTYGVATQSAAGLMSPEDKQSLENSATKEYVAKQIEDIQIGVINLMDGSSLEAHPKGWSINTEFAYFGEAEGRKCLVTTAFGAGIFNFGYKNEIEVGESIVVSVDVFCEQSGYINVGDENIVISIGPEQINKWVRVSCPIKYRGFAICFYNRTSSQILFSRAKIERGNKATDWLPSINDIQNKIRDMVSS